LPPLPPWLLTLPYIRYRSRFFELLHICLVLSSKIPVYLSAAFAKKLARLSLSSPPSGALIAITLIHNMIQKHPALLPLIHRTESAKGAEDPFLEEEADPQQTKAMESSLWELEALESHYCPAVRTLSGSFHTLFSELKVTPVSPTLS
jgi:U3 small nucleolar RNA-associated protein 19